MKPHHNPEKEPDCGRRMPNETRYRRIKKIREEIKERVLELNEEHDAAYLGLNIHEKYEL